MKTVYSLVALVAVVLFTASIFLTPVTATSQEKPKAKALPLPDSVNNIVQKSCVFCHAEGGKSMAMAHINLSKWETYAPDKQMSKALDMCKEVTKGAMPPKSFKSGHPDGVPSAKEVATLCNWAHALKGK
jgi:hypothetical protein